MAPGIDDELRRRLRPWAIAGAVVVAIVTGTVVISYTPIFGARVVEVEGEERLAPRQVMRMAGVELGTNVVHLDARESEARLEAEPWILDATVETSLPGTITISVRERSPLMVLADGEGRQLVAADGTVLGRAPRVVRLPEVIAGPGAPLDTDALRNAGEAVRAMAPTLRARVGSLTVAADGTIALVVDGDIEVRYGPVEEPTAKAQALRAIMTYADEEERGLLSIDVSSPTSPTARFVGSQLPISVPDPSADALPLEQGTNDGNDAEASGATPSPSP